MTVSIAVKQNCIYVLIVIFAVIVSIGLYRLTHQEWITFREAETEYNKKNFKQAIRLYEMSLDEGLSHFFMSANLGNSYVALGKFNEAIAVFKDYLAYHPYDREARLSLAKALSWTGNTKEAEEEYQKILEEKK